MPLYKRPGSPHWWVRIGRKTRRSTGTADRRAAEEFEHSLSERIWRLRKLGDRSAISWAEATQRWLNESQRARSRDREFLKWLAPRLDHESVSAVSDPDAIEQLRLDAKADGWAPSTIDRLMNTVNSVLHACHRWRCLDVLPAIPKYNQRRGEPRWLTPAEFARLCAELPPHLEVAARFAVYTMLRMRAQSSLTWTQINMKEKRAWIARDRMKAGHTFGFPLSTEAMKALRDARALHPTGERVFQFEGRPVDNFRTPAFIKAVERAKVAPLRWHDLRHTGASWAVQGGVTLPELMVLGDWRSYQSVLIYAHFAPSHAAKAAEKVARMSHTAPRRQAS